jgi:hypothetical protein
MDGKNCTGCHKFLPLSLFSFDKRSSDGRQSKCRECYRAYLAKKREDPAYNKKMAERLREIRFSRLIKTTETERRAQLKYKYKLSVRDLEIMKEMQGNRCAICGIYEKDLPRGLVVDHDHELNKVRGMLCHECNKALGIMKDDSTRLRIAAEYLDGYNRYLSEVG